MAGHAMNNRSTTRTLLLGALLLLAGCGGPAAVEEPPLAGARIGGPFKLVNEDGRTVTDKTYAGKYRVMYFGYSFCPDVCPTDVQKLMQGYRQFAEADPARARKVQPIFVSVDPARDTPAVMKTFTDAFGPDLVGLTGTDAQIADVTRRYAVVYSREQSRGASGYLMNHSRMAMLFGPEGTPIALLPADESADKVAAELARWVV
jgi:protein SCO1/2